MDDASINRMQPRPDRLRLGFLGTGWIGTHRLETLSRCPWVKVAAIADSQRENAEKAAQCAPGAAVLEGIDALLQQELDGIVIATPSAMHSEQAASALLAGFPVFCQKPLARTASETKQITDIAREKNLLLGVDFAYRFVDGMQAIRNLIRSGQIGEVYGVQLTFHNAYGPDRSWYYDLNASGGGCIMDLGIHLIDLLLWTLDYPEVTQITSRLFAAGKPQSHDAPQVEDYAVARIDLKYAVATLSCSWKLSAGCDAFIEASFYGTRGGLAFRNINGSFYDFYAERFQGTKRERLPGESGTWWGRAAVDWAERLAENKSFDGEAEKFVKVAEVIDAIYSR